MTEPNQFPSVYAYEEQPCHKRLFDRMKPSLAYDPTADYPAWRERVRQKLWELTGMELIAQNGDCDLQLQIEYVREREGYTETRLTFQSERDYRVPCYLLVPTDGRERYPVAITLQGHSTGFHNSVGELRYERDVDYQPRGQFGIQAVRRGFAALCIEQRGMGERRPRCTEGGGYNSCTYTAMQALQMGRTILGERAWDVHRAIDLLEQSFPVCDTKRVVVTGNSGGGTATFYAACFDERIGICAPSCAFCPYRPSILDMFHCSCNYIPSAYRYFDMQDLACLIAPRQLSVIAGVEDPIFPIEGVKEGFATVQAVYAALGASERCSLTVTPREHWWCEELVWGEIQRAAASLGW